MYKPDLSQLIALQAFANTRLFPQRHKSNANMSSDHASSHFGRGMDFAEFRHYQAGDDIRSIDWRVTARSGKTHIRLYKEEKERPLFLLVDQGITLQFGTRKKFKSVLATEIAALMAWSAFKNHDRVGGIILGVKDSKILTPRGNKFGVLNFLNTLAQEQEITTSNIEVALKSLRPLVKSSSIICLISDFEHFSEEAQKQCEQLAKYNDLLFVHVSDPLEKNPPAAGQYLVTDGDQELLLDTEDLAFCLEYQEKFKARIKSIQDFCQRTGIDFYAVDTADDLKSVWAK